MPETAQNALLKTSIRLILLSLLLLSPIVGQQWLEEHYRQLLGVRAAVFFADELRLPPSLAGQGAVRLVHFWDPSCPCNASNLQHLTEIVRHFAERGVEFYSVQKPGSRGQLPAVLSEVRELTDAKAFKGLAQLPASPAAAIWNTQGELIYLGPYSESASCSLGKGFVEPILDAALAGRPVKTSAGLAVACFCDWN